ncbi:uncharacterized protein [Diadema setosum]|uniref:uncharacterized protein n=1 Tax=Diadema setosum TaxID=31175 RepID=UPI003B3A132C
MDKSLDDIIREKKIPAGRFGRGRGGGRGGGFRGRGRGGGGLSTGRNQGIGTAPSRGNLRGQSRGRGGWQNTQPRQFQQSASITDARQKLIQKAHQGDARDRLAKKARQTDARLKLAARRKSGDGLPPQAQGSDGAKIGKSPNSSGTISRTVPNLSSTQFTVRNPPRVQNKTQITIPNPQQPPPQQHLSLTSPPQRSSNPLLAGASTLRVTKAVAQPQKRPAMDYPHYRDDLLGARQPNPPKVQRRMPEDRLGSESSWISSRIHAQPATHSAPQGTRLIISNLQKSVTGDDITELFGAIGELRKARMVRQGLAEVVYLNRTDALQAINTYHNRELDGMPMQCKLDTSTIPEASSGARIMPNSLSDRFKTMRSENNPKLPFDTMPKGGIPTGIDPGVVQQALFKKGATSVSQKPVVFTVKI